MKKKRKPSGSKVKCRLCGGSFKAITARHLQVVHGWTHPHALWLYKAKFGIKSRAQLAFSALTRARARKEWRLLTGRRHYN